MQKVTSIIYIPQEKIAKGLMCVTTAMRTACILVGVGGLKPTGEFRALAWHGMAASTKIGMQATSRPPLDNRRRVFPTLFPFSIPSYIIKASPFFFLALLVGALQMTSSLL